MDITKYAHFRGAKLVQVIRLEVNEGEGKRETNDPVCRVVYWLTLDGTLIGHNDPEERMYRGES